MRTAYGTVLVLDQTTIFACLAENISAACALRVNPTIALTGGSTPKAFYDWASRREILTGDAFRKAIWTVSDERHVPIESEESNYGVAARKWLDPIGIPEAKRRPWPVQRPPQEAAERYAVDWAREFGPERAFDLCLLGMGDDGHTASLFPGSPLLESQSEELFASVDVPGKGPRLTLTPRGLRACGRIVVTVTGASKAHRLAQVLRGPHDVAVQPVQCLETVAGRTTWLVDAEAAAQLTT